MYDPKTLKTAAECRRVMARAKEQGDDGFYEAVFRRLCELPDYEMQNPNDPLVKDFYATLAAYEQLLTEKNGRNQSAGRTRQKIKNKGIEQSLIDWTNSRAETLGFKLLIDAGLHEFTGEYVVARHASRFPADVVAKAKARLQEHGIQVP